MPPKNDEFKYVDKNMSIADLTQIATHANIDIKSLTKKPELLKAIKSVDPPFPKRYNLLRNKWSSDPADATEPSTAAQPTEEEEEISISNQNRLSHEAAQQQFVKSKCKYVQPIATIFFRFSHRDKKNKTLTNLE